MKLILLIFNKVHLVLMLLLISGSTIAQHCGVGHEFHETLKQNDHFSQASRTASISPVNGILYIPLTIHFVRHTNGSYSKNNSLEPLYHSLLSLNRVFSNAHIQFYINGNIDYINNDDYLYPVRDGAKHIELLANYKNPNTANIWILDGWSGSPGIAGLGGPSGVELADLSERTVIHEFGHFFTLIHTFDFAKGVEKVKRVGGNCATAGDEICDTEADPSDLKAPQLIGEVLSHERCVVTSNTRDLNNDPYTPPFDNFMSYYDNKCGFKFTPQQYERMVASIPLYHSSYTDMQGAGLSGAPASLKITAKQGYDEISWVNSSGSLGTIVEYSTDGGGSWTVMIGVKAAVTKSLLSDIRTGNAYLFRARHLNSITYSSSVSYTPANAHPIIPIVLDAPVTDFSSIGGVSVANTSLNNQTNIQENYTFNAFTPTPAFFIGGNFNLDLKVKVIEDGNGGTGWGPTYMYVYLDENGDGDFDDAGEVKYREPNRFGPMTVSVPVSVSSQATTGYKRMRIRSFAQNNTNSPNGMYNYSETEDYLIQFVKDVALTSINSVYNESNKTIELTWTDNTNDYNYVIERSIDGVNFLPVETTTVSTPKLYVDSDIALGQKYFYRVKHVHGALYSTVTEQFIKDIPPTLTGVYNQQDNTIDLSWTDNTNAYNYIIERSIDGINFSTVKTTTVSTPKVYADTDVVPDQEYSYRIKHVTGTIYSSIADVMTTVINPELSYCLPESNFGCYSFELSEFAIPSINFVNNTAGNCGYTSEGYSDLYATKTINLIAGNSYAYTMKNDRDEWYDFNMHLDVNQNGIFEPSEALVNFHTEGTDAPFDAGPFVVPVSAINGYTRLRLRNYIYTNDPCTEAIFGETEDYKVLISGGKEGIVINTTITHVETDQISVSWSARAGSNPTGYKLKISTDGISYSSVITLTGSQASYTYTGLQPNQRYFIQVVALGTVSSDPKTMWTYTLPLSTSILDGAPVETKILSAYPNPVSGILTIKAHGIASLVNEFGQVIMNENIDEITYWNMNGFSSGVYFLYIQNEDHAQVLKIIKQ
ncbi:GEVED domain-containing protein [Cytophaga hutchinsonii]|nr:GEVED domain-containing protein [Cytophaga hutchinsonii]